MQSKVRKLSKQQVAILAIVAITIIMTSIMITRTPESAKSSEIYVGVEVAYGDFNDLKAVVTEVKNFTNLVVLGLPEVSINRTLLDESCNYIVDSGLHFIVLFTNTSQYSGWMNYTPAQWVVDAKEKYGDKFVAVYRWDEAGGDQLDNSKYQEVRSASSYTQAAERYVDVLNPEIEYYQNAGIDVLTADYGLYWFDYQAGYDAVLAEFGWNNSREQQIALVRGGARTFDRDWGAMITWKYSNFSGSPYIESGTELFDDLLLAYNNGAKYAIVFDYPKVDSAQYGILTQDHLTALHKFWNYSSSYGRVDTEYKNVKTAYVLPADYGFGFRNPSDTVWGLWSGDSQTRGIYSDVDSLIRQKGAGFDIVCNYPTLVADTKGRYEELIFWNGTRVNP